MGDDVKYIEPEELREALLLSGKGEVLVLDVRDADATGGKIRGAVNVPSESSVWATPSDEGLTASQKELVGQVSQYKVVVTHCAMSKQRGPACARALSQIVTASDTETPPQILVLRGGYNTFASEFRRESDEDPLFQDS